MLHNIEEEAHMKGILEVLDKNLRLALKIDEVVGRLSEKRVTLEEKMIRSYFHQVGANLLELSAWLNRSLSRGDNASGRARGVSARQDTAPVARQLTCSAQRRYRLKAWLLINC